ncbi:hypothetical protein RKD26_002589 [Streptomyces calvus]
MSPGPAGRKSENVTRNRPAVTTLTMPVLPAPGDPHRVVVKEPDAAEPWASLT